MSDGDDAPAPIPFRLPAPSSPLPAGFSVVRFLANAAREASPVGPGIFVHVPADEMAEVASLARADAAGNDWAAIAVALITEIRRLRQEPA